MGNSVSVKTALKDHRELSLAAGTTTAASERSADSEDFRADYSWITVSSGHLKLTSICYRSCCGSAWRTACGAKFVSAARFEQDKIETLFVHGWLMTNLSAFPL